MNDKKNNETGRDNLTPRPDPETLHTTDPQEHMSGPVSSTLHQTGETFDTNKTKEEADEKKERGI